MQIKRSVVDTSFERKMLIGMIISSQYLAGVLPMYRLEYCDGSGAGVVAGWCIDYYKRYEKAPGKHIQDIFEREERGGRIDEGHLKYIEMLLSSLSDQYERSEEEFNSEYLLDQVEEWFRKKSLELTTKDVQARLSQEDVDGAEEKIIKYNVVKKGGKTWVDPFSEESIQKVFEVTDEKPLFRLRGMLDKLFDRQFMRGTFISFQGPEKRGKSWFLLEIAMMAYKCRCNVALFEAGDLTEKQSLRRLHTYISRRPVGRKQITVQFPKFVPGVLRKYKVEFTPMVVDSVSIKESQGHVNRWRRSGGRKEIKMSYHVNDSLNVREIRRILDTWKRGTKEDGSDGFEPDVIIIDYADIMAPEDSKKDFRHQQDDRWKALRALSQSRACCVITATQTSARSYGKRSVGVGDFSEDKRKYGHVTAMYGLNRTPDEKDLSILRVSEIMVREGAGVGKREVSILQCIDLGMPYVDSAWEYEVDVPKGEG